MDVVAEIERIAAAAQARFAKPSLESRDQQIIRLYVDEGSNLRETAAAVDCCIETVRNVLRRYGYATRPWGKNRAR